MSNARNIAAIPATTLVAQNSRNGFVPAGVVLPYAGPTAPSGWLLCQGQTVSRTTYSDLFAAIGTTYGAGDGSTTFVLPDLGGRVPAGKEATATRLTTAGSGVDGATLGATGGAQTHTLTIAQMPAHDHNGNGYTDRNTGGGGTDQVLIKNRTGPAGGGAAHNNVQPTIVLNYIIKT